ncbi:unnamed protein product [Cuscuta europaea]|uniref:Uncharacterized protein n=1 Tax=Cuscuta europaea TaxID=41803 RepID=A0A9P0ZH69_CUSEU|nr:unnamed protein product [Cuscuta europaea]
MLTVGKEILLEVQSTIRVRKSGTENTSCYLLIIYPEPLALTTLSDDDLVDNFTYADLKGNPNTLSSGCSSWSYFRKGEVVSYYSGGWSSKNADHDGRYYYTMMGKDQGISRVSILEELPLMTCHMSETTENRELGLYPEARAASKWKMEQRVMSEDQYQPDKITGIVLLLGRERS